MRKHLGIIGTALVLLGFPIPAKATTINYDLAAGGGGAYTYTYTVYNNTLGLSIDDFIIYFPDLTYSPPGPAQFTTLAAVLTPAGWTANVVQPSAPNLNGYVEWYATPTPGVGVGASLSGFSASFVYTGAGTPGSQDFEIYDASLLVVDSYTTQASPSGNVPDQGGWFTCLLAGLSLAAFRLRCGMGSKAGR